MIIAIDGPSGVGKGTVARAVAAALGYRHVDTGAMYRAVAWRAIHDGQSFDDEEALAALGIVGPTRMDYPTTMASVRAVARYVSEILDANQAT